MGHEGPAFALVERSEEAADALVRRLRPAHEGLAEPAQPRLGLEELPGRIDRLAPGMVYAIVCAEQAVRVPLAANALAATLRTGKPCALVTPAAPSMLLRKARLAGFALHAPLKAGALAICRVAPEAPKHLFRLGAQSLISQLERHIPAREALVVIDEADALFVMSDPGAAAEAAERYTTWAASRDHTVLALFAPSPEAAREFLTLRRLGENFAGFALARATAGGVLFEVRHWFAAEGANTREGFQLRLPGAQPRPPVSEALYRLDEPLAPVDSVICVRGALAAPVASWHAWEEVESIAHGVDAARRSEAATLLLPFERPSDYEPLARAVAEVRGLERASLRIVVRERALRLRSAQLLALMRLGASSVIPADVPDAAVKRMTDALHGTRFARPYDRDLRQVEAETTALLRPRSSTRGSFFEAVERLLAATDGFDVESCLVGIDSTVAEPWRVLAAARRQAREFVAFVDDKHAWFFWYGCPAEAAPQVLKRILGASEVDLQLDVYGEPHGILGALERLRRG
ncbi:MAG: BcsE family c-di-GMP-binding protein [Burkholderiales bacterium]